jgi:hypothetical protein
VLLATTLEMARPAARCWRQDPAQRRHATRAPPQVPKPCCKMTVQSKIFSCDTEWDPMEDLPFGNPFSGNDKWQGPGQDTGTFNGSTIQQDLSLL